MSGKKDVSTHVKPGSTGRKTKTSDPSPKKTIRIWLDSDVIEQFRSTGPGWQNRINETLKRAQVD